MAVAALALPRGRDVAEVLGLTERTVFGVSDLTETGYVLKLIKKRRLCRPAVVRWAMLPRQLHTSTRVPGRALVPCCVP